MSRVRNEELIKDTLSVEERDQAADLWIKYEQDRLRQQSNFKKLNSSLKLVEVLKQMLRLKGRFGNTLLDYEQKYPIILRGGDSSFTKLLIEDSHGNSVKAVVVGFQVVGLYYAGPLLIKTEKDTAQKAYILLFTCATSRAIRLELTPDMLIPSFLRGFKRFSSRRGMPDRVISDNFKTFKANEVKNYFVNHSVKQSFILPASPWSGGFYERLLRSVKLALKKTLGKSFLSYEELETMLYETEYVINCRPLVYLSDDDIHDALTPFHLLYGRNLLTYKVNNDYDIKNERTSRVSKRFRKLQTDLNNYWTFFEKLSE